LNDVGDPLCAGASVADQVHETGPGEGDERGLRRGEEP